MPILKRALLTIAGNVIVIFVLALLARNYILNPDLLAIERASDQRDIQRFEQALDRYRLNLEGRIKRIYAAAGVLESLDSSINWQPIIQHLAKIGGYEEPDYFILADDSGQNALLQAGEFVDRDNSAPSQKALNEILAHILPKLERHNLATISGLYKSKADGPIAYAAGHASWSSKKLPSVYIAVRRLNHTMIPSFTEALGLSAQAISEQTLKEELKSNNVELVCAAMTTPCSLKFMAMTASRSFHCDSKPPPALLTTTPSAQPHGGHVCRCCVMEHCFYIPVLQYDYAGATYL